MPTDGADDAGLGQRAVDHALAAELAVQILGHAEDAAVDPDVLADDEHVRVALHLLEERQVQRLDHVQLRHRLACLSAHGRARPRCLGRRGPLGGEAGAAGRPPSRRAEARCISARCGLERAAGRSA